VKRRALLNDLETAVLRHCTAHLRAPAQRAALAGKAGFRPDQPR
jgi:hypothetical protein